MGPFSFDIAVRAVAAVRERLLRSTAALARAGVDYAVAGGNAVAYFVAKADELAARLQSLVDTPGG